MTNWLDLSEASNHLGLSVDAIRKKIKQGRIQGRKVEFRNSYKYQVLLDSIPLEPHRLKDSQGRNSMVDFYVEKEGGKVEFFYPDIIETHKKQVEEQGRIISTLSDLLTNFQQRIISLEHDRTTLENKLKMLPAPPEEIIPIIKDKEENIVKIQAELNRETVKNEFMVSEIESLKNNRNSLNDELAKIQKKNEELAVKLQLAEKPWWKKLLKIK